MLFVLPEVFTLVLGPSFDLPCLLATAILDSFSLFYLPNKGKLEVVKQEIARVNLDILGISELKWTGMSEFNSDDHYIYYAGRNPSEEMQ